MERRRLVIIGLFALAAIFFFLDFGEEGNKKSFKDIFSSEETIHYQKIQGDVFGTYYHIQYACLDNPDLQEAITEKLAEFNASLSNYDPNSVISKINKNEIENITDHYMKTVFIKALEVSKNTQGAFDITVAPLVNYWGFGFTAFDKNNLRVNALAIDSLKEFIGYKKISLDGDRIIKEDPRIQLDVSAIAKGYGVDVVADLLAQKGCENYLVEIGGEVVTKGINSKGKKWKIGINKPIDNPAPIQTELQAAVAISGKGLASSGNYRQYYELDGKKYSHTIDPTSGYPVEHNLLATSVIAENCMTADAYATAFMVMGVEKSLALAQKLPDIEAFLIYENETGKLNVIYTDGFKEYLVE